MTDISNNQKLKKSLQMKKYRLALKEKDPVAYLLKQKESKSKNRKLKKDADIPMANFHGIEIPMDVETHQTIAEKPIEVNETPMVDLCSLVKSIELPTVNLVNADAPAVEVSTLKRYLDNIRRLSDKITNEPMQPDMLFLKDVPVIQNYINLTYKNINTKMQYYKSIVSITRRLNFDTELINKYAELMMECKKQSDVVKGANLLSKSELVNYIDWSEILNMDIINLSAEDQLLYTLLTALPPRRLDYKYLKVADSSVKLSKKFNYLIINNGMPSKLIYYNFKTIKSHGPLTIDLNSNDESPYFNYSLVREAIDAWYKVSSCVIGELVFKNSDGNIYFDFSKRLHKLFQQFEPKLISTNILRHAYLTHIHSQDVNLNILKKIATYMSNSVLEGLAYRKFKNAEEKSAFENLLS